jgi:hypothetical protein
MVAAVRGVTYGVRTNVLGVAEDLQIGLADDRNRTGVDGFAGLQEGWFFAYLGGFRGPQMLSGALGKRSNGQPCGQPHGGPCVEWLTMRLVSQAL